MSKYVTVNLKREYIDAVDKLVEEDLFISSRAEFVRRAIEKLIKEYKKNE